MHHNSHDFMKTIERDRRGEWERQARTRALRRKSWRRQHR
jgi:hypothetical protein